MMVAYLMCVGIAVDQGYGLDVYRVDWKSDETSDCMKLLLLCRGLMKIDMEVAGWLMFELM